MLPEASRHPQCLPIDIPADDPFYRNFNQRCMNFVRTTPGLRPDCNFGYAEQVHNEFKFCLKSLGVMLIWIGSVERGHSLARWISNVNISL